jgi:hypothetical protein
MLLHTHTHTHTHTHRHEPIGNSMVNQLMGVMYPPGEGAVNRGRVVLTRSNEGAANRGRASLADFSDYVVESSPYNDPMSGLYLNIQLRVLLRWIFPDFAAVVSLTTHPMYHQMYHPMYTQLQGIRFASLATFPYYDAVVSLAIDPMYTLFQGIAGSIVKKWINDKIICKKELGRLFHKYEYAKGLGKLTAADWMNFVFTTSTAVLSDSLPADDLKMWKHYVDACTILCSHYVVKALLPVALNHFRKCFALFAQLYGEQFITPSMHQALHLPLLTGSFGPVYIFGCFG